MIPIGEVLVVPGAATDAAPQVIMKDVAVGLVLALCRNSADALLDIALRASDGADLRCGKKAARCFFAELLGEDGGRLDGDEALAGDGGGVGRHVCRGAGGDVVRHGGCEEECHDEEGAESEGAALGEGGDCVVDFVVGRPELRNGHRFGLGSR